MRLTRPRYTILSLMIVVLLASLVLTVIVALRQQRQRAVALRAALVDYQNARLTLEVAEIAVAEYTEGIFKNDLATVEGEIKLAESDLMRSEDRLDWARQMFDKGKVPKATKESEELSFKKAQSALEQTKSKRKELIQYTKGKMIKELVSEVENAKAAEQAKKVEYDRLKAVGTGLFW